MATVVATRKPRCSAAAERGDVRAEKVSAAITGCLFDNLSLELSAQDAVIRSDLEAIYDEQISILAKVLDDAGIGETRETNRSSTDIAAAIIAQLEGMVLFAKLRNDASALDGLWDRVCCLVG
ncbi:TetR family transcriptional regulator C-terminal domain-containing protein [Rhodococcus sovatensis]|uniref:TetR family transcriptional regulator C-terminal domain-containing protein n=1 Tax=Rhodococcus sovatensis TaxID=1805840 RepID=A0ABZ2PFQ2_9NOCA